MPCPSPPGSGPRLRPGLSTDVPCALRKVEDLLAQVPPQRESIPHHGILLLHPSALRDPGLPGPRLEPDTLVGAAAGAILSQWGLLRPVLPGHVAADHLQEPGVQLPACVLGPRPGSAVGDGPSGGDSAVLRHQGQPAGGRGAAARQPAPDGRRGPARRPLPLLADPGAEGGHGPGRRAPGAARPGGRPAGGGHRRLGQLGPRARLAPPARAGAPARPGRRRASEGKRFPVDPPSSRVSGLGAAHESFSGWGAGQEAERAGRRRGGQGRPLCGE